MRDDLQDLVDDVSRLLGAPATLEDADFTLLAFCAHVTGSDDAGPDEVAAGMDAVRTRSILTRRSSAATRRWFEDFGIASATGPLRTPADPAAGVLTRLCLPVRHDARTHGYLWLLDEGRTDVTDRTAPALRRAEELALEAGRLLADRGDRDADLGRALHECLTAPAPDRARRTLERALGAGAPLTLVALHPGPGRLPAGWSLPGAGAVSTVLPGAGDDGAEVVAVLVPLPRPADLRPAGALTAAALGGLPAGSTAGVAAARSGCGELAAQWREAGTAARVAAVVDRFSPVAHWTELGVWRQVAALPPPDAALDGLLADPLLAGTAEVYLDCAGSVQRAAAALCVHRQTLYYRLARVAQLTGLDLTDGEHRLLLHAGLKSARLARGLVPRPPGG
ncbi:PucR family transcriptional regulator [Goekera deserti]|uniref:PucR family transcriptional regulator n=1 Tax=Goekera deserti TaxID=2497753 RepID=UPI001575741F|nr:helix-turn-helix domain-containing protein [Goekera deserti]